MLSRYVQHEEHNVPGENNNINVLLLLILLLLIHSSLAGFLRELWVNDKHFSLIILLKTFDLYSILHENI